MFHPAVLSGGLAATLGCAGSNGSVSAGQSEPVYQTPPLPEWSAAQAEPESVDPSALDGEVVGEQPALDDHEGQWVGESPQKPVDPEKNVDAVPEEGQNSSTAPSDRGTVPPPQSD